MRVWSFPGQGSQYTTMLQSWQTSHLLTTAKQVLGSAFFEQLNDVQPTEVAQPLIVLHSAMAAQYLLTKYQQQPEVVVGHSIGEITALFAAGSLDFRSALWLARMRGEVMRDHTVSGTCLLALYPLKSWQQAEEVALRSGCEISAYNSPSQVVIGGTEEALDTAVRVAKELGVRRTKVLRVSAAFHTKHMQHSREAFRQKLLEVKIAAPTCDFISTVSGQQEKNPAVIRDLLIQQLTSPVLFSQAVGRLPDNVNICVLGPGKALKALIQENLPKSVDIK